MPVLYFAALRSLVVASALLVLVCAGPGQAQDAPSSDAALDAAMDAVLSELARPAEPFELFLDQPDVLEHSYETLCHRSDQYEEEIKLANEEIDALEQSIRGTASLLGVPAELALNGPIEQLPEPIALLRARWTGDRFAKYANINTMIAVTASIVDEEARQAGVADVYDSDPPNWPAALKKAFAANLRLWQAMRDEQAATLLSVEIGSFMQAAADAGIPIQSALTIDTADLPEDLATKRDYYESVLRILSFQAGSIAAVTYACATGEFRIETGYLAPECLEAKPLGMDVTILDGLADPESEGPSFDEIQLGCITLDHEWSGKHFNYLLLKNTHVEYLGLRRSQIDQGLYLEDVRLRDLVIESNSLRALEARDLAVLPTSVRTPRFQIARNQIASNLWLLRVSLRGNASILGNGIGGDLVLDQLEVQGALSLDGDSTP